MFWGVVTTGSTVDAAPISKKVASDPLAPPDTSSPRATVQSFITALNNAYTLIVAEESEQKYIPKLERAMRCLDLHKIAPEFRLESGLEAAVLLKEIIDRIGLPPYQDIPGVEDLHKTDGDDDIVLEKWAFPKTEITIALITDGPQKGEYLFDSRTVAKAVAFFKLVSHLDYQEVETVTPNIYGEYRFTPGPWIDRQWIKELPSHFRQPILDQTVWQWAAMGLVLVFGAALSFLAYRAAQIWDRHRKTSDVSPQGGRFLAILFMIGVTYFETTIIESQIRITGGTLRTIVVVLDIILVLLVAWAVTTVLRAIAESIIANRRLRPKGIDSQLVRLTFRFITILVVMGLFFHTADRLGVPAYSVLTGLGVGGLAVAFAARETLANFLGSIMIMFDRPFRIGDWIKVGDSEGTVQDIGFRSTKIRTFYDSVLSIPNAETVNVAVDNMGMRQFRRVRTVLQVTYDTPVDRLESFVEGIKVIIRANPHTRKDYFHVVFNDFGAHSLDIMVYFFLKVPDWTFELIERERIFLEIIHLAESLDVSFAFPTRTLHVETLPKHIQN